MELTNDQRKSLLGQGFIPSADGTHFACRVLLPAGKMNAEEARKIAEVSEKYGKGVFNLTQRANVEIPWVKHQDLDKVALELKEVGLSIGGTGIRVRPALVCKGAVCKYGFINTEAVAKEIDERFYRGQYKALLPNKFRISISGCTNGCSKPQLGCLGLQGRKPDQVAIIIGGMFGKDHIVGRELPGLYSINQALDVIDKAITYYRENGLQGERFARTVERLGFETVVSFLVD
jgi:Dissimilatory sulfite reductase (desulfoviridin), alpha and beta subunits